MRLALQHGPPFFFFSSDMAMTIAMKMFGIWIQYTRGDVLYDTTDVDSEYTDVTTDISGYSDQIHNKYHLFKYATC